MRKPSYPSWVNSRWTEEDRLPQGEVIRCHYCPEEAVAWCVQTLRRVCASHLEVVPIGRPLLTCSAPIPPVTAGLRFSVANMVRTTREMKERQRSKWNPTRSSHVGRSA